MAGRVATKHVIGNADSSSGAEGAILLGKLHSDLRQGRTVFTRFDHQPSVSAPNGYGDPTGTTGDINRAMFRSGLTAQYHVKGTQTLLAPLLDTTGLGLDISQDQTDNDGVEYAFGANNSYGNFVTTIGTDPDPYIKLKFKIVDVSGTDDCCLGFRKVEAFQANVDDYDEGYWANVNLGTVVVESILNNAATVSTTTSSTWADNATHTIEVRLVGRQPVVYFDGSVITGLPAFQFDSGEVVLPFFFFLQATTSPGKVYWLENEVGRHRQVTHNGFNQY